MPTALNTAAPDPPAPLPAVGVACRGIEKEFGSGETRTRVLHGIDVEIGCGALTLLVGPSGCGKTTLISIIAGLLDPTAGDVSLFGTPQSQLRGNRRVDFRARNVGFVFQQYNLLPSLTAAENVAVPLLVARQPRKRAIEKAAGVLDAVGLGSRLKAFPNQLSGGQQQRVAIARALVHEPRLLVCDEPTAALDSSSGQTVMELLKSVAVHPERTVIVVTHDSRVLQFGDRLLEMADGRIVLDTIPPSQP
ncbi:MAG: ABC transporter ATP-binding protein [Planctomycetota bacterium]|nr:ABC transporter ATP-binding protein [Planctomycetota bacterium]